MIAIVNVSKNLRPTGIHDYELRINNQVTAQFKHNREDDLATCLRKAADVAERAKWEQVAEFFGDF